MLVALVCIGSFFLTLYQMVLMGMLTNEAIDVLVLDNISSLLLMMVVLLIGAWWPAVTRLSPNATTCLTRQG